MENREPEGHIEDLMFLEPRRLHFGTASSSTRKEQSLIDVDIIGSGDMEMMDEGNGSDLASQTVNFLFGDK
ncbi:hypothetical protein RJT34_11448 [Clitoria ternatea]|uniref:Uncharacterized protein n=1 Tax=Clitoria ternatea TaxID=43366 RepID=A0AAN9JJY5_CLITE